MDIPAIRFKEKLALFEDQWSPRIIGQMNDYHLKLVKIEGEFIWHTHPQTDEVFIVLSGSMKIEFRDSETELHAGEMCVVPKGVEHKPVAEEECEVLLIEPIGTLNTGDVGGERTKTVEIWI